jgi:hypothetical protein
VQGGAAERAWLRLRTRLVISAVAFETFASCAAGQRATPDQVPEHVACFGMADDMPRAVLPRFAPAAAAAAAVAAAKLAVACNARRMTYTTDKIT